MARQIAGRKVQRCNMPYFLFRAVSFPFDRFPDAAFTEAAQVNSFDVYKGHTFSPALCPKLLLLFSVSLDIVLDQIHSKRLEALTGLRAVWSPRCHIEERSYVRVRSLRFLRSRHAPACRPPRRIRRALRTNELPCHRCLLPLFEGVARNVAS